MESKLSLISPYWNQSLLRNPSSVLLSCLKKLWIQPRQNFIHVLSPKSKDKIFNQKKKKNMDSALVARSLFPRVEEAKKSLIMNSQRADFNVASRSINHHWNSTGIWRGEFSSRLKHVAVKTEQFRNSLRLHEIPSRSSIWNILDFFFKRQCFDFSHILVIFSQLETLADSL